jgi:hypothetical protein
LAWTSRRKRSSMADISHVGRAGEMWNLTSSGAKFSSQKRTHPALCLSLSASSSLISVMRSERFRISSIMSKEEVI